MSNVSTAVNRTVVPVTLVESADESCADIPPKTLVAPSAETDADAPALTDADAPAINDTEMGVTPWIPPDADRFSLLPIENADASGNGAAASWLERSSGPGCSGTGVRGLESEIGFE